MQVEEAFEDQALELIDNGDQEPEDTEPELDTVSADTEEESDEEEYTPTVTTSKLPVQLASDKERKDHSSQKEEKMCTIFDKVIKNQEKAARKRRGTRRCKNKKRKQKKRDLDSETRQKKEKTDTPTDESDVEFVQMFGPSRREAEPLPVVPAERQDSHSFHEMKLVLEEKNELSDLHIDHFSALLKEQFPLVDGLQKTAIFESEECNRVGTPVGKFIQILLVGRHWVTVSNMHCLLPGEVMVYDSFYDTIRPDYKSKFFKQLGWLLFTKESHMVVKFVNVQKQKGSVTCGLFALAFAHALCSGLRPERLNFYEENMWIHLRSCLSSGVLTQFPVQPGERDINNKELHGQIQEEVFCICRQPDYPQLPMITCDTCHRFYHKRCMNLSETTKRFKCTMCRQT